MSSNQYSPRNPSTPPQSIPLQDLSRPPDLRAGDEEWRRIRRQVSGRARALLGNRQSFHGRVNIAGRYERVGEGSPPDADHSTLNIPHITTPRNAHQPITFYDDGELSPVNPGEFQTALGGSVGLSLEEPGPSRPQEHTTSPVGGGRSPLGIIAEDVAISPLSHPMERSGHEVEDGYFAPLADEDRTPLRDERYLQPISGSQLSTPSGQRHDRYSLRNSRNSPGSRLGDDLVNVETDLHNAGGRSVHRASSYSTRSLARSLSTSASPLSSAGSMLRKMSQRVVNLSNEPELMEQTIRRQASTKQGRMEGPPLFPAMTGYAHDEPTPPPIEKAPPLVSVGQPREKWQQQANPLKGKSLGIFAPNNRLRLWLCELLVHPATEPVLLILIVIQTVLLAIDAAPALGYDERLKRRSSSWIDTGLLILFTIYTLEIIARAIVSGLIRNADEYSTLNQALGFKRAVYEQIRKLFVTAEQQAQTTKKTINRADPQLSILRSFTTIQAETDQPDHSRQQQRVRLARRAFLRHSFNRLDFLAVVSFWISFILSFQGLGPSKLVYVFQMLSCLRILRLLGLTSGTSIILRSLKKAAPLLANVAFLISFFWLLFAIIGTQSFKSSFRRTCVWFGDDIGLVNNISIPPSSIDNYTQNVAPKNIQFCGGHLDAFNGSEMPWVKADLRTPGTTSHKGFLCPQKSLCVEGQNPYNNTVSFDNVLQSLELVFVIMSSNTFSDLLYYTTNSDYVASALFFAFGIVFMSLWLMNLLVAVITSSFQVIREESSASAFTADDQSILVQDEERPKRRTPLKRAYDTTYFLWIVIIAFGLVVQCLRTYQMSDWRRKFIENTESVVTMILLLEILLRLASDWRNFLKGRCNWVDLAIALITAVIQIPHIRNSGQPYAWLTFFQILRTYRVVMAVPLTRNLIMTVLGNVTGLLNLIVFVFLITFLTAIFAVQLFRGEVPPSDASSNTINVTFKDIYNSFIGMYQVLSSENWTILMYNATQYDLRWNTAWIGAIFFVLWFILANFVILNMFIAVIQENFDVSEDQKRLQQVKAFLQQKELVGSTHGNLSLASIFKFGRDKGRHRDPLDYGPATIEMFKDAVVRDFLDEQMETLDEPLPGDDNHDSPSLGQVQPGLLSTFWSHVLGTLRSREPNPFYSRLKFSRAYEELDPRTLAMEIVSATESRKLAQRQYLQTHPRYNVSLFMFKPANPIRRFCQKFVGPGRGGQRVEGIDPVKPVWYAFSVFIYANVVAMVLLACITTPLFQRAYYLEHSTSVRNWFVWTDMGFAAVFTVEAVIKVIADGLFWTPNAYFRGSWGFIDGVVLITLWINVATSLFDLGGVSRAVGAFKALRALRLLNVSDSTRDTFHSIIVLGGWKVISAAFVSLSLLFPFAIYGLNLFNGQMLTCNDTNSNITNLTDCTGEWNSTPYNWEVLAPRQYANPYYNFDNFGNSLFILFQIVSQEGWVDVMWSAVAAAGQGLQPQPFHSQGNSVFFIVFNLLGAVFVLTLFVSVFMRNFTEQTGVAFLTSEQRSWLELRKLLRQISPSKRPSNTPDQRWKTWCYRVAVKKHGRWQRSITAVLIVHLTLLVTESYPEKVLWEKIRTYLFLAFTVVYVINIAVRIQGLSWKRFRRSSWDLYSLLSVGGTIVFTILELANGTRTTTVYNQLRKLFLVSIALLLIPRNNQLDQLFKTAAASLTAIGNLLATWFVLFLVYAIALTQTLGLTRFGSLESANLNFRTVPNALILLFRMSCGEGWNQIMEDYAQIESPFCVGTGSFYNSDCGSAAWARTLFISWNIVSMYIFVSMFVSLIFESFSYVYQRSSGLSVVSREEIRRFKQAWATFDAEGSGYISKEQFPKLLGELSGVFEMRIYDGDHSVGRILEECKVDTRGTDTPDGVVHGIDVAKLNKSLRTINVPEIRRRRAKLELFSQEVLVSADPDRGIPFTTCLMILANYNIITDKNSLRLEEFLRRRYRLQRVQEQVRRNVVIGFFDTLYYSRTFRRSKQLRHSARMMTVPQFAVPEIYVEGQDWQSPIIDVFPPSPTEGVSPAEPGPDRAIGLGTGLGTSPPSPTGLRNRGNSFGSSPARSERSYEASPILRPRRPSDLDEGFDPISFDGAADLMAADTWAAGRAGRHQRQISGLSATSATGTSTGERERERERGRDVREARTGGAIANALEVFDNSAWGESIRRSFTIRRQGTRGRGRSGEP